MAAARLARSIATPTGIRLREGFVFLVVACLSLAVITFTSTDDALALSAVAGIAGLVAWLAYSQRYEVTLAVFLVYLLLFDGFLKLRFDTQLTVIARDILLFAISSGALARWAVGHGRLTSPPLTGWVLAWLALVLLQLANPGNGTTSHSLLGLRPHLEFVPLFFFGYAVMRTRARLQGLLVLVVALTAINGVVGLVQTNLSTEELATWGPGYEEKITGQGGTSARGFVDDSGERRTRPFALGSDQGFGGSLGVIAAPMVLALFALVRKRGLLLLGVAALGIAIAIITSQARVALVGSVAAILAYAAFGAAARRRLSTIFGVLAGAVAMFLVVSVIAGGTYGGIFDRYQSISPDRFVETAVEYRGSTIGLIPQYAADFPFGAGLGTAGPGGSTAGGNGKILNGESEFTYLLIETGVPGLVVLLGLTLRLLLLVITRLKSVKDPDVRLLLAALSAPLFGMFLLWFAGITTGGTPTSTYLWFVAGVLAWWLAPGSPRVRVQESAATTLIVADQPHREHQRAPVEPLDEHPRGEREQDERQRGRRPHDRDGLSATTLGVALCYPDPQSEDDAISAYTDALRAHLEDEGIDARRVAVGELAQCSSWADVVILQYNPFSFARRGFAPDLLTRWLRLRKPRTAVMVHEPFVPIGDWRSAAMGGWQRVQLGAIAARCDHVFVSIEGWRRLLGRSGRSALHLPVPSLLPDRRAARTQARAQLCLREDQVAVATLSSGHPSHDGALVEAAARAVTASCEEPALLALGAASSALQLPSGVREIRPGRLDDVSLAEHLAAADLFLAPLIDGVSTRRTSVMAALQHQIATVGTYGELTDPLFATARDAGPVLVEVNDPDRFAAVAGRLASDAGERAAVAAHGRALYEDQFDWSSLLARLLPVLKQ